MINRRAIVYLLLGIAITGGAHALLSYAPVHPRGAGGSGALLEGSPRDVRAFSVRPAEGPAVGLEYDGSWRITSPFTADADDGVVMRLIDSLFSSGVRNSLSGGEMARLGRSMADFGLDPAETSLSFEYADGGVREIGFGAATPDSAGVYCRIAGMDTVFVVAAGIKECTKHPAGYFRRRAMFRASIDEIESLDIRRPGAETVRFEHSRTGWSVDGAGVRDTVQEMLAKLLRVSAVDFVLPDSSGAAGERISTSVLSGYGLDGERNTTVAIRCFDGRTEQLVIGDVQKNGVVYATTGAADSVVVLPSDVFAALPVDSRMLTDDRAFAISDSDFNALHIVDGDVEYSFARDRGGRWSMRSPVSMPVSETGFPALLSRVMSLRRSDAVAGGVVVSVSTNAASIAVVREKLLGRLGFEGLCGDVAFSTERELVRRISVQQRSDASQIVYDGERSENNSGSAALDIVSELKAVRIEKLIADDADMQRCGLVSPAFTVVVDFRNADQIRRSIKIGERTDGGYYAAIGASGTIFVIPDSSVIALVTPLSK